MTNRITPSREEVARRTADRMRRLTEALENGEPLWVTTWTLDEAG